MPTGSFVIDFGRLAMLLILSAGLLLSPAPTEAAPAPFPKEQVLRDVAACARCKRGSHQWLEAFHCLFRHPKKDIIRYIRETCTDPNESVRYHCYRLAGSVGWPDLLDYAECDLAANRNLVFGKEINSDPGESTLADTARNYIDRFRPAK
jgi:hypothetical protein